MLQLRIAVFLVFGLALTGFVSAASRAVSAVPPGAAALGYTKCVIDDKPTVGQIAPGLNGDYDWFNGMFYEHPKPPMSDYFMDHGVLAIKFNGKDGNIDLMGTPEDWSPGKLPILSGASGFYAEFEFRLSDNNLDHWDGVWLMPIEHNNDPTTANFNHYAPDPAGSQRWMELDVDESGFGPGRKGTVISWFWPNGGSPKMQHYNANMQSPVFLDRTKWHTYGASYDPVTRTVTWWLDGVKQMSASGEEISRVSSLQHYYLILSAYSHGKNVPYTMYVRRVRAFVSPSASD